MTLEPFWRINLMLVPVVFPNNFGHTKVSTNIKTNMGHLKVSTNINKVWSHKSVDKYCLQQLDGASCCLLPPRQSQKSRPDVSVATRWEYIHNYMYKYKYKYKYKYTFCVTREQRRKDNCEELPDESVGGQVDPSDGWPEGFCQGELDSSLQQRIDGAFWLTFYDILDPQESQIIRVTSPDINLDGVVDRIGSGLLYVDHGAHTPLVIIARNNGLFGWEHYPDWKHRISDHVLFQVQHFFENSRGKLGLLRRLPKADDV